MRPHGAGMTRTRTESTSRCTGVVMQSVRQPDRKPKRTEKWVWCPRIISRFGRAFNIYDILADSECVKWHELVYLGAMIYSRIGAVFWVTSAPSFEREEE